MAEDIFYLDIHWTAEGKYFMSYVSLMAKWAKFNHIVCIIFPYILYFISNIHVINTFSTFSDVSIAVDPKAAPWNMLYVYVMLKTQLTLNSLAFIIKFYPYFLLCFYSRSVLLKFRILEINFVAYVISLCVKSFS